MKKSKEHPMKFSQSIKQHGQTLSKSIGKKYREYKGHKDPEGIPLSGNKGGRVDKQRKQNRKIDAELRGYSYR